VFEELAVEVGVARVGGVNSNGGVAEHGFGAGGGDCDAFICE
jgi:hypothetical protein